MALNDSQGTIGAAAPSAGNFPANHKFYERKFLEALQPEELYKLFGDQLSIPSNTSNTISLQKVSELASLEGSPLTEGVTPTEQTLSLTRIEKSLDQYGGYVRTTDRLSEESINGITAEFSKRLGQQAARTMNRVCRDGLLGGTNVRYQGGVANQDLVITQLAGADVIADMQFMVDAFRLAYVKPFSAHTPGSPNDNTNPTAEAYPVIVPVEAVSLIEATTGFQKVETYLSQVSLYPNEFGRFGNFRFMYDPEVNTVTNVPGDTIAQCLVFGKGMEDKAYATVDLAGGNLQMITKPLGSSGSADPLDQRASMGWKAKQATFIKQDTYMFRWEVKIDAT